MKAIRAALAIVIALVGVLATPGASAQITTYSSCFQLVNTENLLAIVVLRFYDRSGGAPTTFNDTINPHASKTYCPLPVSPGFEGSVVVTSNTKLASIVNVYSTEGMDYYAAYTAFLAGSPSAFLPLLMKANYGFNTWFHVQNAGTIQDTGVMTTTVTVNYSDNITRTCTVDPGYACKFDQATEPHINGWVGSASVGASGGQEIAAAVVEVGPTTMFAYSGFTGVSPYPAMPLINANNFGYVTGIQIFNSGNQPAVVTVGYTPSTAGTLCSETQTIAAGQSATFALHAFTAGGVCGAQTFVGSGRVLLNNPGGVAQPLTAIVNQLNQAANKGAAYGAFNPSAATRKLTMPLIMGNNFGYFTGAAVHNIGTQTTFVVCDFNPPAPSVSGWLDPGESLVFGPPAIPGYIGSALCTATGGDELIVGMVNELNTTNPGDAFMVYEAINLQD
jgi:hypothetical protein